MLYNILCVVFGNSHSIQLSSDLIDEFFIYIIFFFLNTS